MNRRDLGVVVGVLAFAVGLAVMGAPSLLTIDRIAVSIVGVLALLQAYRAIQRRRRDDLRWARTPDPELPDAVDPPGDDLGDQLARFSTNRPEQTHRTRVQNGLEAAAIAVLTRYANLSTDEARASLADGSWTDDAYAAAFLGTDVPSPPLRGRLGAALVRESTFKRSTHRTVDAIYDRAGLERRSTDGSDDGPADGTSDAGGGESAVRFEVPDDAGENAGKEVGTAAVHRRERVFTGQWNGIGALMLVGVGTGILLKRPAVVLAGAVAIGFSAYARSSTLSRVDLYVERTVSDERPASGDEVEVTVTIRNGGERSVSDLRAIDGVPDALAVHEGSPRIGTALRPGDQTTFTYAITARRGTHTFRPLLVLVHDLAGSVEQEVRISEPTELVCTPTYRALSIPVPLRRRATPYAGRIETASGGEGIEFHTVREYRSGDAMSRIDWKRRARTGSLTTVESREERSASVVLVIDVRERAYVAPDRAPHAVDRAVDAAGRIFTTLVDDGNRVGLAALGANDCWLEPGSGSDHQTRARELLSAHPALGSAPSRDGTARLWTTSLRRRLRTGTQLVVVSPLCDDGVARHARRLDAHGYPVTVVAPDPTVDRTPGHRFARVDRRLRITDLRSAGIPVVDWPWDDGLDVALARFGDGWSR